MRLRTKVLAILGLVLPILAVTLHFLASRYLMRGFERLEAAAVNENVCHATHGFSSGLEDLGALAQEWAAWDDICQFIEGANPEFRQENLTPRSLRKLNVDIVVLLRQSLDVAYAARCQENLDRLAELPPDILRLITANRRLTSHEGLDSACQAIMALPDGLLLVASRPLLSSNYEGPVRGTLVFGRYLTPARLATLRRKAGQMVEIHPLPPPPASPHLSDVATLLAGQGAGSIAVRPLTTDQVGGYTLLRDVADRPVALMGVEHRRTIFQQGRTSIRCLTLLIVAFGLTCLTTTLFILDRLVLSRIAQLSRYVSALGEGERPPTLPRANSPDELTLLAGTLNDTFLALVESRNRLRITQFSVDNAGDPVIWIAPDARLLYVNEAACRKLGYTRQELLAMTVPELDPNFPAQAWTRHWAEVRQHESITFESVHRAKDGRLIPVEITVSSFQYEGEECNCAFVRDITDRKRADARLRHAAMHDALTGLPNRELLTQYLAEAIARSREDADFRFAVMFLDFDRFKIINDSLGHQTGDELLIAVSHRLQDCLRDARVAPARHGGVVARLGGDEFVILLNGIHGTDHTAAVAELVQQEVSRSFDLNGYRAHVTVSIGIVSSEAGYESPADVLRDADTAMYHAKTSGKARHVIFDRHMHDQAMTRLQLENDLRKALDRQEITVAYQPIISLESGEIEGFEALARWMHPRRGEIGPDEFIPVAEETGLILPLGWAVLHQACSQWLALREQIPDCPPLIMSVNVSKRQLMDAGLIAELRRLLSAMHIPPDALKLEITESIIMSSAEAVTPVLAEIKRLGIRLAMDDFGQGHSSLGCLHRFPIDDLKIDRAFVGNMGMTDAGLNIEYTAIVQAIITLAHNLGMRLVAEGVETAGQLVQLQSLGCDMAQGFYFARPATPQEAADLITSRSWMGASAAL